MTVQQLKEYLDKQIEQGKAEYDIFCNGETGWEILEVASTYEPGKKIIFNDYNLATELDMEQK